MARTSRERRHRYAYIAEEFIAIGGDSLRRGIHSMQAMAEMVIINEVCHVAAPGAGNRSEAPGLRRPVAGAVHSRAT